MSPQTGRLLTPARIVLVLSGAALAALAWTLIRGVWDMVTLIGLAAAVTLILFGVYGLFDEVVASPSRRVIPVSFDCRGGVHGGCPVCSCECHSGDSALHSP
ncbi:MAG TPA: hypothetical protein VIP82_20835 [Microbacterium sp.]|uniref:hypothetical protein n=1 Tax=Microbacterium sp. TaxID=51671 RepID=UPI002F928E5C